MTGFSVWYINVVYESIQTVRISNEIKILYT